jgi:hypothetical protein
MKDGKEKILQDWFYIRNAILRADQGEMKITHVKSDNEKEKDKGITGIVVDLELKFPEPLTQEFTEAERKNLAEILEDITKESKKNK